MVSDSKQAGESEPHGAPEDIGQAMLGLADICAGSGKKMYSLDFDYSPKSLQLIDQSLAVFHPEGFVFEQVSHAYSAYVGEVIRRSLGGEWVQEDGAGASLRAVGGAATIYPFHWLNNRVNAVVSSNTEKWDGNLRSLQDAFAQLASSLGQDDKVPEAIPANYVEEHADRLQTEGGGAFGLQESPNEGNGAELPDEIVQAPANCFLLVAAIDGEVDAKESEAFLKSLAEYLGDDDPVVREVAQHATSRLKTDLEQIGKQGEALAVMLPMSIVAAKASIDERYGPKGTRLCQVLYDLAHNVASASGGFLGIAGQVSKSEQKALDLIRSTMLSTSAQPTAATVKPAMASGPVHTSGQPMIQLRRLFRFFGQTRAVNDVSFEVESGQVFGYIGPNGAGKTTSMRILSTLDLPDYGDALVDGFSVVNDPDRVRKRLGFMPDNFGTYPNMNCVEYLDFFARSYGIIGRDRTKALRHTLAYTGLDKIAEKPIRGLSKGMRQRLCLGRAMIHDPSVLILDEPANGLDPRARIELRHMIRGLAAEGKSLLVSSHILTELGEMCDAIGIIERGQLIISGTVEEIKARLQPYVDVLIQLVERGGELGTWLDGRPGVSNIQATDLVVRFQYSASDPKEQSEMLRAVVTEGFPILEYTTESRSLEDVFLQITTGAVQ